MLPPRPRAGPFLGERLLALGGHGVVWSAGGPHGPVALKVARTPADREHLAAERDRLAQAAHPHLLRLVQGGPGWIATELVHGQPLHAWAAGRTAEAILERGLELVSALAHLHAQGLVHGDVTPRNVLVDDWGHVKLVDLSGASAPRAGTPGFTAPEVLRGAAAGPAADLWGLGATLYAALAGEPPFPSSDPAALQHLPTATSPIAVGARRVDVPDRVERLLAGLLLRDPARRPSLDDVAHTLTRAWKLPPRRPVLGMVRARRAVHAAVSRAADGEAVVVLLHGSTGTGRRTLIGEAMRQARLEGLTLHRRHEPEAFLADARAGRRPVAATRLASAAVVEHARAVLSAGRPALLVLYGPSPSDALAAAGALHVSPDALGLDDARRLGAWLGVEGFHAEQAWRRSQGHPRALWVALEPHATRHTGDRTPFSLPASAASVVAALRQSRGVVPLDRLAARTRLPMPVLVDQLSVLESTGRLVAEGDGWLIRLLDPGHDAP